MQALLEWNFMKVVQNGLLARFCYSNFPFYARIPEKKSAWAMLFMMQNLCGFCRQILNSCMFLLQVFRSGFSPSPTNSILYFCVTCPLPHPWVLFSFGINFLGDFFITNSNNRILPLFAIVARIKQLNNYNIKGVQFEGWIKVFL